MSQLRMAAIVSLAFVLTACGTAARVAGPAPTTTGGPAAHGSVSPASSPASPPTPTGRVLTVADNGATVTVTIGQQLTVDLAPGTGAYAWDRPRLTGSALRPVSVAGGYPSRAAMQAVFLAVAPGTAVVSTVSDMQCLHSRPRCLPAQLVWKARVIVRSSI